MMNVNESLTSRAAWTRDVSKGMRRLQKSGPTAAGENPLDLESNSQVNRRLDANDKREQSKIVPSQCLPPPGTQTSLRPVVTRPLAGFLETRCRLPFLSRTASLALMAGLVLTYFTFLLLIFEEIQVQGGTVGLGKIVI